MPHTAAFEKRAVLSLASLYAFRMLGLFMVLPVLTLYGRDYAGSTPFLLGLALGVYGFSQAILQIPFGMLSDRIGRKPVIAMGLVLFGLGSVVAATADSVTGLIIGRLMQGSGAIASAIMALVTDLTADENRTKAMAVIGMSIGLSFSLALVIGPLVTSYAGLSGIFWLTALFAVCGLLMLYKVVPTPRVMPKTHREAGTVPAILKETMGNPELLRLNFGIFVLHLVLMASFIALPSLLEDQLGIHREQHWRVYLPLLCLAFVAMVPFIILAEAKRKMKPVFVGAICLLGLMEFALAYTGDSVFFAFTAIFLFFMAFNLLEACLPSLVSKVAPPGSKGTASGIYSSCQFFGAFCGGVLGGWLADSGDISKVFIGSSIAILAWAVFALFMTPPKHVTSVLLSVSAEKIAECGEMLRALPGVEEWVFIEEDDALYLKVDERHFDMKKVRALGL
jgi:MFS family permease